MRTNATGLALVAFGVILDRCLSSVNPIVLLLSILALALVVSVVHWACERARRRKNAAAAALLRDVKVHTRHDTY
ncbi:MAG: hypothetical protein ACM3ZC_01285 [Bacteroidota bacterium]